MTAEPVPLFDTCAAGCGQPVEDPRDTCLACVAEFGDYLRPAATVVPVAEFRRIRDRNKRRATAIMTERARLGLL